MRLEGGLGCRCGAARVAQLRAKQPLTPPMRLGDEGARPAPERAVLLLMLCLEGQPPHLWLQLGDEVGDADEIVPRLREPAERLVLPNLERLHPGRLLEELATLLGPQRQSGVDGPLPDDDEGVGTELALAEQVDDVAQPGACAVDEVFALPGPIGSAPDGDLGEVERELPIGVVEGQDRFRHALRASRLGAREDDILGAPRAQVAVRLFAEHPAHRVGHVALARAVRADHRVDPGLEHEAGRVGEGLEAVKAQLLEAAHDSTTTLVSSRMASAASAACSSARWRLEPSPRASCSPARTAATVNTWSCGGPEVATRR